MKYTSDFSAYELIEMDHIEDFIDYRNARTEFIK